MSILLHNFLTILFVLSLDQLKAKKHAALSILTAPFRVVKKTIALKVAGWKLAKALKAAKIAKAAALLTNLKKGPIFVPIKVAVPSKDLKAHELKAGLGAGLAAGLGGGLGASIGAGLPAAAASIGAVLPSLGAAATSSLNPLPGIISGAQKAIQSAGASIPFLSTLTGGLGLAESRAAVVPAAAPTYR